MTSSFPEEEMKRLLVGVGSVLMSIQQLEKVMHGCLLLYKDNNLYKEDFFSEEDDKLGPSLEILIENLKTICELPAEFEARLINFKRDRNRFVHRLLMETKIADEFEWIRTRLAFIVVLHDECEALLRIFQGFAQIISTLPGTSETTRSQIKEIIGNAESEGWFLVDNLKVPKNIIL